MRTIKFTKTCKLVLNLSFKFMLASISPTMPVEKIQFRTPLNHGCTEIINTVQCAVFVYIRVSQLFQIFTWFANARRRLKKENKVTWNPRYRSNYIDSSKISQRNVKGKATFFYRFLFNKLHIFEQLL